MAKNPTSNYTNGRTFTCSVPAEVLAGEYPYKIALSASKTYSLLTDDSEGYYDHNNMKCKGALLIQSKYPIFIEKKTVGQTPVIRETDSVVTNYTGYNLTASQYYVACFNGNGTGDNNLFTVDFKGGLVYENDHLVMSLDAQIRAQGDYHRMAFYKNVVDGTYHRIPYNGQLPSETSIVGKYIYDGVVQTDRIEMYADGYTSETTVSALERRYMADRYYAGSGLYTGAPLSAPSLKCLSKRMAFNVSFMDHSGTGTREWDGNNRHYTSTITCNIASSLTEIENMSFNSIAEWYTYCEGRV
jgi:hypothetical protein